MCEARYNSRAVGARGRHRGYGKLNYKPRRITLYHQLIFLQPRERRLTRARIDNENCPESHTTRGGAARATRKQDCLKRAPRASRAQTRIAIMRINGNEKTARPLVRETAITRIAACNKMRASRAIINQLRCATRCARRKQY